MPNFGETFNGMEAHITKFYRNSPLKIDLTFIGSHITITVLNFDKINIEEKSVQMPFKILPKSTKEMVEGFE